MFQSELEFLEKNFYINRWCRLFWNTVRMRGILQFRHCESWKSFNTALSNGFWIVKSLTLKVWKSWTSCPLLKTDLLLLWNLLNGFIDSNLKAIFVTSTSRIHHFSHFEISKNRKFKTEENFWNRSQRAANHLMRMKIIDFDMPKCQFTYAIDQLLRTRIKYFDLENSCSFYIYNAVALFAELSLNLITFWSVKVVLTFFVRFYVLP